jgi:hypothetical protein
VVPAKVSQQIRLAHEMRNKLTELALAHDDARKAEVARIEGHLGPAKELVAELDAQAKAGRPAHRTMATRPEVAAALRNAAGRYEDCLLSHRCAPSSSAI